ncbi:hypothetical protein AX17_007214 [Amanita inopinata Kibby_2008]|nr:hypothetical protein AX17_007214 [Amanita inopinata Kibby_2008]
MMTRNNLLLSVLLAVVYASSAFAAPYQSQPLSKYMTHRTRQINRGLTIETYHPASTYETFGEGIDHPLSKRAEFVLHDSAKAFAASRLGVAESNIKVRSGFGGEMASHAYLRQAHDDIPFANAVANVAFNNANKVVSFGSSFVSPSKIASSNPTVQIHQAISSAEQRLDGTYNNHPATLEYLALDDGSAALTHVVQIQNKQTGAWYEAFVDAHSGHVISVTDFVSRASYRVLPFHKEVLSQGFQTVTDPYDEIASQFGWHDTDHGVFSTDTSGNNAVVYHNDITSTIPQSSDLDHFIYRQRPNQQPTTTQNIYASGTNAFYIVNTIHDYTHRYGFTEAAFNFQFNNFGLGGIGNDPVTVSIQDPAGTNNAYFATPPDGQSGHMSQFLWTLTSPPRDGALENDVVTHENTHGVTNRLTGGGTARCLQTVESGGLGEGWSDAMADWAEKNSTAVPDFVLGQYVVNDPRGIRSYPYSTSKTTNPLTYHSVAAVNEVHAIGEVWANMLHNVYAELVGAHGWSAAARTNPSGTEGNIVYLHLFIDQLSLQPCNPTFLNARDAWLQADTNRYNGAYHCTLWKAFASRGLGINAANFVNDFNVPSRCV